MLCLGRASKSMTVHAFTVSFLHLVVPPCHELDEFFTFHCVGVGVDHGTTFSRFHGQRFFYQHSREEGSSSTQTLAHIVMGIPLPWNPRVENIRWPRTAENTMGQRSRARETTLQHLVATRMVDEKCEVLEPNIRLRIVLPMLVVKTQASHP